jgi:Cu2+-exporting ATPase
MDESLQHETMDKAVHGRDVDHKSPEDAEVEERIDHAAMGHGDMDHASMGHTSMDHTAMSHATHGAAMLGEEEEHAEHAEHAAHVDHTGHEEMFRRRFWVSLILSIPVLLYSPMIQVWLGFSMPAFPGSQWIEPVFSVIVFLYGGLPFLRMAS